MSLSLPIFTAEFDSLNIPAEDVPKDTTSLFSLAAAPQTNLWRRVPGQDTSTAPILFRRLRFPFTSAEVRVCADWALEWDQAGLLLFVGQPTCSSADGSGSGAGSGGGSVAVAVAAADGGAGAGAGAGSGAGGDNGSRSASGLLQSPLAVQVPGNMANGQLPQSQHQQSVDDDDDNNSMVFVSPPPPYPMESPSSSKWVKLGIEYSNRTVHVSITTSTQHGSDWSLCALPNYHSDRDDLKVKFERMGISLWLYYQDQHDGWKRLREISDFFYNVEDKTVRVGVYASRPASFEVTPFNSQEMERAERDLMVEFDDLRIY